MDNLIPNPGHIVSGGIGIIYLDAISASLRARDLASRALKLALYNSDATGFDISNPRDSRYGASLFFNLDRKLEFFLQ